jgi:hypothetical protein
MLTAALPPAGAFGPYELPARPGAFRRGCHDTFELGALPLGELQQVVVQHRSASNAAWYLERLELLHVVSGARYVCSFRCWLNSQRGGRKAARARRLGEGEPATGQCTYDVIVTSSDMPGEHGLWALGCQPNAALQLGLLLVAAVCRCWL